MSATATGIPSLPLPGALARYCLWCMRWISKRDRVLAEAGAQVTDGMCRDCARGAEAQEVGSDGC